MIDREWTEILKGLNVVIFSVTSSPKHSIYLRSYQFKFELCHVEKRKVNIKEAGIFLENLRWRAFHIALPTYLPTYLPKHSLVYLALANAIHKTQFGSNRPAIKRKQLDRYKGCTSGRNDIFGPT